MASSECFYFGSVIVIGPFIENFKRIIHKNIYITVDIYKLYKNKERLNCYCLLFLFVRFENMKTKFKNSYRNWEKIVRILPMN